MRRRAALALRPFVDELGITSTEVGVAAPADGRKLKMILKDDSAVRTEARMVQIEPGQRLVVKW